MSAKGLVTRRGFGAGLAGIIAAGVAPSASAFGLRRGVAARTAMAGGKGGLTAKDYVQDGLVAMWDGIENAGLGVHDPNATVWKDLVGGREAPINTVGSDYIESYNKFTFDAGVFYRNELSIHCVFARFSGEVGVLSSKNGDVADFYGINIYSDTLIRIGCPGRIQNNLDNEHGDSLSSYTVDFNAGTLTFVKNGTSKFSRSYSETFSGNQILNIMRWSSSGFGRWCHIGIYNNSLTPAEIATNYAIDKERFNLT